MTEGVRIILQPAAGDSREVFHEKTLRKFPARTVDGFQRLAVLVLAYLRIRQFVIDPLMLRFQQQHLAEILRRLPKLLPVISNAPQRIIGPGIRRILPNHGLQLLGGKLWFLAPEVKIRQLGTDVFAQEWPVRHAVQHRQVDSRRLVVLPQKIEPVRQLQPQLRILRVQSLRALQEFHRPRGRRLLLSRNLQAKTRIQFRQPDQEGCVRSRHSRRLVQHGQRPLHLRVVEITRKEILVTRQRTGILFDRDATGLGGEIGFAKLGIDECQVGIQRAGSIRPRRRPRQHFHRLLPLVGLKEPARDFQRQRLVPVILQRRLEILPQRLLRLPLQFINHARRIMGVRLRQRLLGTVARGRFLSRSPDGRFGAANGRVSRLCHATTRDPHTARRQQQDPET